MPQIKIRTDKLNLYYGANHALKDITLSIRSHAVTALIGPSGCGKSTFLKTLNRMNDLTDGVRITGKVYLDGEDLFALDEKQRTIFRRRNIGFIFQAFHLISELTVEQNIIFPLLLDRQKPDQGKLEELMEVLGIANRRKHLPSQLSGGQQQRVAIGRALIMSPMLILADEPTGNLDSRSSRDVMDLLVRASRHYQQTVLMITHNRNLTSDADRVLQVADGVLKDLGGRHNEKLS